jgi:NAD-dependent deacetylase
LPAVSGDLSTQAHLLAGELAAASQILVVTGAGISVPSGISPYRAADGTWLQPGGRARQLGDFEQDPAGCWQEWWVQYEQIMHAQPNSAHMAIAELQRRGKIALLVTQNVDGLHARAGSDAWEAHGTFSRLRCGVCAHRLPADALLGQLTVDGTHPCPRCGYVAPWRPDVVLGGEALEWKRICAAQELAERADLLLVVGSSMATPPIGNLPVLTLHHGGRLAVVNQGSNAWSDRAHLFVDGDAAVVLPAAMALL